MKSSLVIRRGPSTPEGTFGEARFSKGVDQFAIHSLELPNHGNTHDDSRIPAGSYIAYIMASAHFGRDVLRLISVPGREAIEVHPGNFAGDRAQGYHADVRGCILLGLGTGMLTTPEGKRQRAVIKSNAALDMVLDAMGEETEIRIIISQ